MATIFETEHFIVHTYTAPQVPHNARRDGGHIIISPRVSVATRQELSPQAQVEFAWLASIVGEAFLSAMNKRGVDIARINYQDNGNYKPSLHLHLYGRARSATKQPFGSPFVVYREDSDKWKDNEPLSEGDIQEISAEIIRLAKLDKYSKDKYCL